MKMVGDSILASCLEYRQQKCQ